MRSKLYFLIVIFSTITFCQNRLPDWTKGVVWYQIFPERFADGDATNEPEAKKVFINEKFFAKDWVVTKWTDNWFKKSDWENTLGGNVRDHLYERRYGGDIQGIIDHLDYLKNLGVGAIYLNPVFEAVSLHKYDGSTFHHIDVNFGPSPVDDVILIGDEIPENPETWKWTGADKLFLKLIDEVHKRGMKIIIDGVFNHTGVQFWAFQDLIKNQGNSKYKDWYRVLSFDDPITVENEFDYKGWWNAKSLPEFNRTTNDLAEGPKEYIFNSTKRWMDPNGDGDPSDGIDGWRLDVAREVPLGFWNEWSKIVKNINPQSIIVGELWELSPDFVSEDGPFDALMNYNFAFAVNDFFIDDTTKISVDEFIEKLDEINETYPEPNLYVLQNLLSSHDTERLSSLIQNPDRNYDSGANEENINYDAGKPRIEVYEKQKLIAAFQILYRGAPMIYYGDEVGMWGADDPHCRKPMIWDNLNYENEVIDENSGFKMGFGSFKVEQNKELLKYYKKIISIKNNYNEFKNGSIKFIYANNDKRAFAFECTSDAGKSVCIFNLGDEAVSININYTTFELFCGPNILESHKNKAKLFGPKTPINVLPNSFAIYKSR